MYLESKTTNNRLLAIIGPTASGKTSIATKVAIEINGEIISADSRQVYRKMDIGTGKDLCEYSINGRKIPYHLINICEPGTQYNIFEYKHDAQKAIELVDNNGHVPIICGGSGLYIETILGDYSLPQAPSNEKLRKELDHKELDELVVLLQELKDKNNQKLHNSTDLTSKRRVIRAIEIEKYLLNNKGLNIEQQRPNAVIIGVDIERDERRNKISKRLKHRLQHGMIEEIQQLLLDGVTKEQLIYYGLEYKFVTEYVVGNLTYDEMYNKLEIAIHQFAKRQMTWFRGMERKGYKINWIDRSLPMEKIIEHIINLWKNSK